MNPTTGEIYSMVSLPSYDPSTINDIWEDQIANDPNDSSKTCKPCHPGKVYSGLNI